MASGYSSYDDDSGPSRQRMQEIRRKFEAQSQKPTQSQKETSRRGQASGGGPGPSSQVQAIKQKFDATPKQQDESRQRSQTQRLCPSSGAGHLRPESRGPVQELRQKYEALSDKTARSQKDGSSRRSPRRRSGASHQDPGPSGAVQERRQKYEALSDKSKGSHREGSRQGSRSPSQGSGRGKSRRGSGPCPTSEPSFFDSLEQRGQPQSPFDSLEQRGQTQSPFDSLEQRGQPQSPFDSLEQRGQPQSQIDSQERQQQSFFDSLEERDEAPSFSDVLSSTMRGDQLMDMQHPIPKAPASPHEPQPGPSRGYPDQSGKSAQDKFFEKWYYDNLEKVENCDFLNREVLSMLSQYIPGINVEDSVPSMILARMLRDFIEDLNEKFEKVSHELVNIRQEITTQGQIRPQDDSYMSSPRRSRHSSGYQASSAPSPDSFYGGPPRPQLRRRRMAVADNSQSTASPEYPQRQNLQEPSRRYPSRSPLNQRSVRSPSQRGSETDELMNTREISAVENEGYDRPGVGYFHSDMEDFLATRKLEPRANTTNARMESFQDQLREINQHAAVSSSEAYDSQYSPEDQSEQEPSMDDDHSGIVEPIDDNRNSVHSPDMLGRLWNPRELDLQLQDFNAARQQGSSRGSPGSFQEQPTGSSTSEIPGVGNQRVHSPGLFGRRWNPQDLNEQLERFNAASQQVSGGSEQYEQSENTNGSFGSSSHRSPQRQGHEVLPWDRPGPSNIQSQEVEVFPWSNLPGPSNDNQRRNNDSVSGMPRFDPIHGWDAPVNLDLGNPKFPSPPFNETQEEFSFSPKSHFGSIEESFSFYNKTPPPINVPLSHSFSPSAMEDIDPDVLEEVRHALNHPLDIPDEDFYPKDQETQEIPTEMNEQTSLNEVMPGVTGRRRRAPSQRPSLSQEEHTSSPRSEQERPVQDLNRRCELGDFSQLSENDNQSTSFIGSQQSPRQLSQQHSRSHSSQDDRQSPQQHSRSHSSREERHSPMAQDRPPQDFNRRLNLADAFARMQADIEPTSPSISGSDQSYRQSPQQHSRSHSSREERHSPMAQDRPPQDFNRRLNLADAFARIQADIEPTSPSISGSDQSYAQSPQQNSRSHSSAEDRHSPMPQQRGRLQDDLNRRWGPGDFQQQGMRTNRGRPTMEEQFAMWRAGAAPYQQENESVSEEEWDAGCY